MMALTERFESKVDRSGGAEACHPWKASVRSKSAPYGNFWADGKTVSAHVFAFEQAHGRKAQGVVMHSCNNKLCCNPLHLSEGTHAQNSSDAARDGLYSRDPKTSPKLTTRQAVEVICNKGVVATRRLASVYGVNQSTICDIQNGKVLCYR